MKTVGKQLQEARLAKNWTPELAARETKIKVDRLRDLETDDYSHFTSPTYARGFVRTYARALGLDEYRILRQLDNKLPDDDSANIVTDTGIAYLPETALPPRAAHRDFTGLYIVMGLGAIVATAIVFVLFEAYRVGELSRWFATSPESVASSATAGGTNAPTATNVATDTPARALPVDSNTPPPIAEVTDNSTATNAPSDAGTVSSSPRALPVDPALLGAAPATNAPSSTDAPIQSVRALPVDPSELAGATPPGGPVPTTAPTVAKAADAPPAAPRALPVDPSELTASPANTPSTNTAPVVVAVNTPPASVTPEDPAPAPSAATPTSIPSSSARQSNSGPVMEPSLPAVSPPVASTPSTPAAVASPSTNAPTQAAANPDAVSDPGAPDKQLVLTASHDSFVRVTDLDAPDAEPLCARVLHSGESVSFQGHKFSINVGVPSAVDITLDGVNYGPHSDNEAPETFTVQSHLQ
jgi:cytoskeleton protein RodZ